MPFVFEVTNFSSAVFRFLEGDLGALNRSTASTSEIFPVDDALRGL